MQQLLYKLKDLQRNKKGSYDFPRNAHTNSVSSCFPQNRDTRKKSQASVFLAYVHIGVFVLSNLVKQNNWITLIIKCKPQFIILLLTYITNNNDVLITIVTKLNMEK